MSDAVSSITRVELYNQLWSTPVSTLCERYGLSYAGILKICSTHDIPRPPSGYWSQKKFGKAPDQEPLPDPQQDCGIL